MVVSTAAPVPCLPACCKASCYDVHGLQPANSVSSKSSALFYQFLWIMVCFIITTEKNRDTSKTLIHITLVNLKIFLKRSLFLVVQTTVFTVLFQAFYSQRGIMVFSSYSLSACCFHSFQL